MHWSPKSRQDGVVSNRAVYVALGINLRGEKELLGLWLSANEGAKFWLSIVNELKDRGVNDVFIASVDGLKGFSEAINAVTRHPCATMYRAPGALFIEFCAVERT